MIHSRPRVPVDNTKFASQNALNTNYVEPRYREEAAAAGLKTPTMQREDMLVIIKNK